MLGIEKDLIPALEKGDEAAIDAVNAKLFDLFTQHQAEIDKLVAEVKVRMEEDQKSAETTARTRSLGLTAIGISTVLVVLGFSFWLRRSIAKTEVVLLDNAGKISAIERSQASIEFDMQGNILTANENFLNTLGYTLADIVGKHHSMFVDPAYRNSSEYRQFWDKLGRGEYDAGEYKRIGKNGIERWIQATYNPILDNHGKPYKVVKFASDITAAKLAAAESKGMIDSIDRSQAMIEFDLKGNILHANSNFLATVGYSLAEIKGQHHRMFVDAVEQNSPQYREFWAKLGRGEFEAGEYKRVAKGGKEIWIQASYNPILDAEGNPIRSLSLLPISLRKRRLLPISFERNKIEPTN